MALPIPPAPPVTKTFFPPFLRGSVGLCSVCTLPDFSLSPKLLCVPGIARTDFQDNYRPYMFPVLLFNYGVCHFVPDDYCQSVLFLHVILFIGFSDTKVGKVLDMLFYFPNFFSWKRIEPVFLRHTMHCFLLHPLRPHSMYLQYPLERV